MIKPLDSKVAQGDFDLLVTGIQTRGGDTFPT
jgi:hypothetical protein